MPSIPLHPRAASSSQPQAETPLPPFLRTPHALFLLELQGSIQIEDLPTSEAQPPPPPGYPTSQQTPLGTLAFPPSFYTFDPKKGHKKGKNGVVKELDGVLMFVGKWQKMRGEVRELGVPMGVVRLRRGGGEDGEDMGVGTGEEVEIVDVIRWKVVFGMRPEPVG